MTAIEKRHAMKFERCDEYARKKVYREVADLENLDEGIVPLSQFMEYLNAIIDEAGSDKPFLYLKAREPSDGLIMGLSIVLYKDKTPEEIASMQEDARRRASIEEANAQMREQQLYLHLKAKYEP